MEINLEKELQERLQDLVLEFSDGMYKIEFNETNIELGCAYNKLIDFIENNFR